jgi:valyl-tRNA synthetase
MYDCGYDAGFDPAAVKGTLNRWIVGEIAKTEERITRAIEAFRYNDAADAIYHFTWDIYCDWYLEFIKPVLMDGEAAEQAETRATAAWALDQILILLHPFMPFITEELWGKLRPRNSMLVVADWPDYAGLPRDEAAFAEIDWLVRLISGIRAVRSEMSVPVAAKTSLLIQGANAETLSRLSRQEALIARLARVEAWRQAEGQAPGNAVQTVLDEATMLIPLDGVIDIAAEKERLRKEIGKTDKEITTLDKRLSNTGFVAKAPEDVVAEARARLDDYRQTRHKLEEALARLG